MVPLKLTAWPLWAFCRGTLLQFIVHTPVSSPSGRVSVALGAHHAPQLPRALGTLGTLATLHAVIILIDSSCVLFLANRGPQVVIRALGVPGCCEPCHVHPQRLCHGRCRSSARRLRHDTAGARRHVTDGACFRCFFASRLLCQSCPQPGLL